MAHILNTSPKTYACNCVGPQNGDPVCPCMMGAHRERELGKRALEILRQRGYFDSDAKTVGETPAEKAKRIGVPLIPARPVAQPLDQNPIVSVCSACGMEMRRVMGFSCSRSDCPCFAKVVC